MVRRGEAWKEAALDDYLGRMRKCCHKPRNHFIGNPGETCERWDGAHVGFAQVHTHHLELDCPDLKEALCWATLWLFPLQDIASNISELEPFRVMLYKLILTPPSG